MMVGTALKPPLVIAWGTGSSFAADFPAAPAAYAAIVDNNSSQWGREYFGIPVVSPEFVREKSKTHFVVIFVYSMFFAEIRAQAEALGAGACVNARLAVCELMDAGTLAAFFPTRLVRPGKLRNASKGAPAPDESIADSTAEGRRRLSEELARGSGEPSSSMLYRLQCAMTHPSRQFCGMSKDEPLLREWREASKGARGDVYGRLIVCQLLHQPVWTLPHFSYGCCPTWAKYLVEHYCFSGLPAVLSSIEEGEKALQFYQGFLDLIERRMLSDADVERLEDLLFMHFQVGDFYATFANLKPLAAAYGRLCERVLRRRGYSLDQETKRSARVRDERIRLGIWCPQVDSHGHGLPIIRPLLEGLDPRKYETHFIASNVPPDRAEKLSRQLDLPSVKEVVSFNVDLDVAKVRSLDLDILFFLDHFDSSGAGATHSVPYFRLARKQATAFFTPATTGIPAMDYYITCPQLDPQAEAGSFSETVVLIGRPAFCLDFNDYFRIEPERTSRSALGIPEGVKLITVGNSMEVKLRSEAFRVYCEILKRVPDAIVALMPISLSAVHTQTFERRLEQIAAEMGVDAGRFVRIPKPSRARQFAIVGMADLFLDFFPFTGTNSILDPLFMGCPTVALEHEAFSRCRIGPAVLRDIGLDNCVVRSVPEMTERSVEILQDREASRRARVTRKRLEAGAIFDAADFVHWFDRALRLIASRLDVEEKPGTVLAVDGSLNRDARAGVPDVHWRTSRKGRSGPLLRSTSSGP